MIKLARDNQPTQGNNPMSITPDRDRVTTAVTLAVSDCINLITRRQHNVIMLTGTAPDAATALEIVLQLHRLQTKLSKHANSVIIEMGEE
jgi:hypothetical protein